LQIAPARQSLDGRRVRIAGSVVRQERPVAGHFLLRPLAPSTGEHADDLPPATRPVVMPGVDARTRLLRARGH
jgi:hypothetical protein